MPNFKEKIKAHFDKANKQDRKQGQSATAAMIVCETIYTSGLVDSYPKLQIACHVGAVIFGLFAGKKAIQTMSKTNLNQNEPSK